VTVYTELLRDRLSRSAGEGQAVASLIADLLVRRARLLPPSGGGCGAVSRAVAGCPERLLDLLAYDETLVRLCNRLGVAHGMLEPFAPAVARDAAERALTRRLPLLATLEDAPAC
jgi:hypothetical protein